MAGNFPEDLLPEILVRLPIKSILRFRCVSKSWNSLITSSKFITAHINHNNSNNCYSLLQCYYEISREDTYALHFDNENLDKFMELDNPSKTREFFYILDCANGLVCLMDSYQRYDTVLLWNPSIRKFKFLPKPKYELSTQEMMDMASGFGFDSLNNDYNFVRIYDLKGKLMMDVFKLSTGCWTDVEVMSPFPPIRPEVGTFLDGVLHWLAYDHSIVGFDLAREKFTKMMLPRELEHTNTHFDDDVFIGVWRGLLSAFERQNREVYCLWVMKEYEVRESWTKMFVIGGFGRFTSVRRNGELVFFNHSHGYIDAYHPETQRTKHDILHLEEPLNQLQMMPYIESLVLLNEGEDLPSPHCISD